MFRGVREIRDAYRNEAVARNYVDERFHEPLGALLHARQAEALRRIVAERQPSRVLEIAPGPARLTVEVAPHVAGRGVAMDASAQMLAEARRRLDPTTQQRWSFVHGDAFVLPFRGEFDLVYTFRFIRHFDTADRKKLYGEIARVLRPGGVLVFDAINEPVSAPLRARNPGEYKHYDALFTEGSLRAELQAAGFEVVSLEGVQHRFDVLGRLQRLVAPRSRRLARTAMEVVDRYAGGAPLEWIVTCRRA